MVEKEPTAVKDQLRGQLEAARGEYHRVLESVTDEQWPGASGNPRWTIGGEFAHIAAGLGTVPLRMESARTAKAKSWMPRFVFDFANTRLTGKLARQHDRRSVGPYFDKQYSNVIRLLDGVEDREWNLISRTYVQRWTVAEIFAYQASHIHEHLGYINVGLGR
jgi:DinB family protein